MSKKECIKCKETKNLKEFYKNRNSTTGMCKVCTKENNKKYFSDPKNKRKHREQQWKKYGIKNMTYERYEEMLIQQDNCCKICGIHKSKIKRNLAVDHDHTTGKIRGLLCKRCNYFLGMFDINFLNNVVDYLNV